MKTILSFLVLSFTLSAGPTLEGISLGKHVSGPKVSASSLKGKIVLVEYWGVYCPPCLRSIPHLKEWQGKYSRDNFVIIANQYQSSDLKEVKSVWLKKGGGEDVTVTNFTDLKGAKVSGIPRCFLFDHTGKLIFDGSPFSVEKKIEEAYKATPGALVVGMTYKYCKTEAITLGKRKGTFASVIKRLEKKASSDHEETVEEATYLLSRIQLWIDDHKKKIEELQGTDPLLFESELKSAIKTIGRHDHADWFTEKSKVLKTSEYRKELTAIKSFEKWREKGEKAGLLKSKIDPKIMKYLKPYIKSGESITKRYPGTIAEKRTIEILDSLKSI